MTSLEYGCEVWNNNKCQALESIQLWVHKHISGDSVMTCEEPVHEGLGLETLKYIVIRGK